MGGQVLKQVPVVGIQAGLYSWRALIDSTTYTGHVVVRGPNAGPIGGWSYPPGSETWYVGASSSGGAANPTFFLTLEVMAISEDKTLEAAVAAVRANETEIGEAPMVPSWQQGAPLGKEPILYTLTDITGGSGQYHHLYEKVTFQMPIDSPQVMPTFYTSIAGLYSIFGGTSQSPPALQVGIEAKLSGIGKGHPGFPSEKSWYWCGRDPS